MLRSGCLAFKKPSPKAQQFKVFSSFAQSYRISTPQLTCVFTSTLSIFATGWCYNVAAISLVPLPTSTDSSMYGRLIKRTAQYKDLFAIILGMDMDIDWLAICKGEGPVWQFCLLISLHISIPFCSLTTRHIKPDLTFSAHLEFVILSSHQSDRFSPSFFWHTNKRVVPLTIITQTCANAFIINTKMPIWWI